VTEARPVAGDETLLLLGASADLGRALLRRLDGKRMTVLATFRNSGAALEAEIRGLRTLRVVPLRVDLSSPAEVADLIARVKSDFQAPSQIVHLAAPRLRVSRFKETTWDDFQQEIDVQVRPVTEILRALLSEMSRRKRGKVVFVLSSGIWNVPPIGMAHYLAAKHALKGIMRSLAAEYAPKGLNINSVSPSTMETAFLQEQSPRFAEIAAALTPLRRNVTTDEVAGVIQFLLSDAANTLTGVDIPVAGGSAF
jgi:3-oxoacyl-[acyl-carrier protein] reductase